MDGSQNEHDFAVCREGTFDKAVEAIKVAVQRGFRVTTNTTLFEGADPEKYRKFFDEMMALGVEGMMVSPGYSYQKLGLGRGGGRVGQVEALAVGGRQLGLGELKVQAAHHAQPRPQAAVHLGQRGADLRPVAARALGAAKQEGGEQGLLHLLVGLQAQVPGAQPVLLHRQPGGVFGGWGPGRRGHQPSTARTSSRSARVSSGSSVSEPTRLASQASRSGIPACTRRAA